MYQYDAAKAADAEDRVETAARNLETTLGDLDGKVKELASNWEGDEQEAYAGVQAKWDNAAASVTQILVEIRRIIGENTEDVQNMKQGIGQRLTEG
ncbi:WXG100 family type VII secretion target [Dietzia cercidiphylli]|mgnify:CR=1 FL=1|uniref:WXG100 family type VII secretion target n=1 Tax=Dietzia cercidiphylli TaxID=498199 RepID=UPI00223AC65D|nr:WXG100 family type VII secretion target [Dietzia cercidiphylli]MCT1513641.1 WXG100 family type VII secretion target [Dietzia cercidiphylli]